ncbi:MAG: TrkA family potassium uptake protein [Ruminococcaceae bacterium]|nr:TrkA family potassium uptake protein [Oscillospiraceae bacterium]
MSLNKSYAVFGLGRYGSAVAIELVSSGAEVLAVDLDEGMVNAVAPEIPICKCADVTDPEVIKQLGVSNIDVVIISMANHIEASVMAIMLCKEAGVKTVIAKCANEMHGKIFSRVGADKVVFPERESGTRLAKNLLSSGFVDMIELNKDVSMVELPVSADWVGKTLIELKLRKKYGINIVAIRKKEQVEVAIDPEMPLSADMKLIVIANTSKLGKLNGR